MRVILLAAVMLPLAALGACGQTGPLYHPPPEQQAAPGDTAEPAE